MTFRIEVDGEIHEHSAATVVVANSGYYGKGMHIAPGAVLDDGVLDVVVVRSASKLQLIRSMPKVYDGTHVELDDVLTFRGREIVISAERPMSAFGDGEPVAALPVTARVLPKALQVLV
jgi:diacylglycerol kinase family enzyme